MTTNGVAERELDLVDVAIAEDSGIPSDTGASELEFLRQWTPIGRPFIADTEDDDWVKLSDNAGERKNKLRDPKIVFAMAQPSGVTEEGLIRSLKEEIGAVHVEIEDMSGGCGQAFSAIIVSPLFDKKTTLARHRMVNTALKTEVAAIHAWTPKCYTPEQWEKQSGAVAPGKTTTGEVVEGTSA